MFADLPLGWQVAVVAIYLAAALVSIWAGVVLAPDLWRAGQLQIRLWLTPDKPSNVVDLDERRRQLDAAAIGRRL